MNRNSMTKFAPSRMPRVTLILLTLCLTGCRTHWQQPDRVITALQINPGDRVADIGAGQGYFTFRLADAVGPQGTVYAVEVEAELVEQLREFRDQQGLENVEVIFGGYEDPLLPDGQVDLAITSKTWPMKPGIRSMGVKVAMVVSTPKMTGTDTARVPSIAPWSRLSPRS